MRCKRSAYNGRRFFRRASGDASGDSGKDGLMHKNVFLLGMVAILILGTLAGPSWAQKEPYAVGAVFSVTGGASFLGCQAYEWTHLIHEGQSIQRNNFGATFFILTGFHGMHVFSGVVYLSVIMTRALMGKYEDHHNNEIEIAALYWHFVDLVWIMVFTFMYLI